MGGELIHSRKNDRLDYGKMVAKEDGLSRLPFGFGPIFRAFAVSFTGCPRKLVNGW